MKKKQAKTCAGCGRPGSECWAMPCLILEVALADGAKAVNAWLEKVDAPFYVEPNTDDRPFNPYRD